MKLSALDVLTCPECRHPLRYSGVPDDLGADVSTGTLACATCFATYPVVRSVPRFISPENYADSFGYQWTRFSKTQLDEHLGIPLSADRFANERRWPGSLKGERILEAGSGMGRFTRCAAATGAEIFSIDFSRAIDANRDNNQQFSNVHFIQADICRPPFADATFDKVFCLGVLQHTPDPERTFQKLVALTRPGGRLVADVYRRTWKTLFWGQYYVRVLARRVPAEKLFPFVESYFNVVHRLTGLILPINNHFSKVASIVLGTADYRGLYPVAPDVMREWCLLDTFDKLSPVFDYPQTIDTVTRWFERVDVRSAEVRPGYNGLEIHVQR